MIEFFDFPDLCLYLFSILRNLLPLLLHPHSHIVKLLPLSFEISVLLLHDGLMVIEELSHLIYLRVLEDLEPVEGSTDLVRRWDLSHLCNALTQ